MLKWLFSTQDPIFKFVLLLVFLVASLVVADVVVTLTTVTDVEATVTKCERVTVGSGDTLRSYYLVFTEEETFKNEDCTLHWKFNSSDIHGRLEEGKRYQFKVYGWRVQFLSWYRNVLDATELES